MLRNQGIPQGLNLSVCTLVHDRLTRIGMFSESLCCIKLPLFLPLECLCWSGTTPLLLFSFPSSPFIVYLPSWFALLWIISVRAITEPLTVFVLIFFPYTSFLSYYLLAFSFSFLLFLLWLLFPIRWISAFPPRSVSVWRTKRFSARRWSSEGVCADIV